MNDVTPGAAASVTPVNKRSVDQHDLLTCFGDIDRQQPQDAREAQLAQVALERLAEWQLDRKSSLPDIRAQLNPAGQLEATLKELQHLLRVTAPPLVAGGVR
jgi:hypothetical protein